MTVKAALSGKRIDNSGRLANIRYVHSSNIDWVGWPADGEPLMLVKFRSGDIYGYIGVSRQRVVAAAQALSVGKYINKSIKPFHEAAKIKQW